MDSLQVFNPNAKHPGDFETVHTSHVSKEKRNCRVSYDTSKKTLKFFNTVMPLSVKFISLHTGQELFCTMALQKL